MSFHVVRSEGHEDPGGSPGKDIMKLDCGEE